MRFSYSLTLLVSLLEIGQARFASSLYGRDSSEIAPRELLELYYRDSIDLHDRSVSDDDDFLIFERDAEPNDEDDFYIFERDADASDELEVREPELEYLDYFDALQRRAELGYAEYFRRAAAKGAPSAAAGKPTSGKPTSGKPGSSSGGGAATPASSGTARYQKIAAAIKDLNLPDGKYAFYRVWDKESHGEGHEELDKLTETIEGSHYALVVGTLANGDFTGFSSDLLFDEKLTKPNGNGQAVSPNIIEFRTSVKDKSKLKFLGKVSHVDKTSIETKAKSAMTKTYDVKSNNCKTYADRLYTSLQ